MGWQEAVAEEVVVVAVSLMGSWGETSQLRFYTLSFIGYFPWSPRSWCRNNRWARWKFGEIQLGGIVGGRPRGRRRVILDVVLTPASEDTVVRTFKTILGIIGDMHLNYQPLTSLDQTPVLNKHLTRILMFGHSSLNEVFGLLAEPVMKLEAPIQCSEPVSQKLQKATHEV
ncbi:hypothetical protein Hamer_G025978 [Homarus americanus]|uniref:Uncharacterized protein n=1 Tax=Homarus americanus TaxID=6706 RepID=A0A8J5NCH6_HOMAM|nr:hypothetical protein Hamer_G025978 [Homarus americanus]